MLKVKFVVEFDENGRITSISRDCQIPRPSCNGCKYQKWCEAIHRKLLQEEASER